jgi:hypothetical protein
METKLSEPMKAWYFCKQDPAGQHIGLQRDGLPLVIGETRRHDGPLVLCKSGLHASTQAIDALNYAVGPIACRVDCGGETVAGDDKLVCRERTVLAAIDATEVLRAFARRCALDVIDSWDAPAVVRQYLQTGDESLREASWAASWAASRTSAASGASKAASEASEAAHWACGAASLAAHWACEAASLAAHWASGAAHWASGAVRWAANWAVSRAEQNERLETMLLAALDGEEKS